MAACRDIARMDREVRSGTWTPHEGVQLLGKTLGVIGLGGIGSEVLRMGPRSRHGGDRLEPDAKARRSPRFAR